MNPLADPSVAILAGGRSSRMGRDKGLVQLGERPLVQQVLAAAQILGQEVFIATNRPQAYAFLQLRLVGDRQPGRGSLEGLRTALAKAGTARVMVLACDMPSMRRRLLEHMAKWQAVGQALVPRYEGRLQPFLAVYKRSCLPQIELALGEAAGLKLQTFLERLRLDEVTEAEIAAHDPDGLSFFNVNSSEDLHAARQIVHRLRE